MQTEYPSSQLYRVDLFVHGITTLETYVVGEGVDVEAAEACAKYRARRLAASFSAHHFGTPVTYDLPELGFRDVYN